MVGQMNDQPKIRPSPTDGFFQSIAAFESVLVPSLSYLAFQRDGAWHLFRGRINYNFVGYEREPLEVRTANILAGTKIIDGGAAEAREIVERLQAGLLVVGDATLRFEPQFGGGYGAVHIPLLPEGAAIIPLAEAKTIGESNYGLAITFGFALVVILLVLAAQFESVWSALIVMATVPFGLACAVFAMLATGVTLNVYSQIGLILVVGIMAKNGILIVEFANQLRDRGLPVREAVETAANIRLRPVVMTMIATVLGGVPLIVAGGAGAEARAALGWIMVGGLSFAAVSTLFLTPVAYLLLARFSKPKSEEEARLQSELAAADTVPNIQEGPAGPTAVPAE